MKLKKENWKKVEGCEFYEVSDFGNVRSLDKPVNGWNGVKTKTGRILKPGIRNGYKSIVLSDGDKQKNAHIHRLVAYAFIPNPQNKETVNHIDGNKLNNHVDNLEWATRSEQQQHAFRTGLYKPYIINAGKSGALHNRSRGVIQMDMQGKIIMQFGSQSEAARETGFYQTGISKCCRGEIEQHKGFKWVFHQT